MTQEEFNSLGLKKGDSVTVKHKTKRGIEETALIEYRASYGESNMFDTYEWDSSFYDLATRDIIEVKIL